MRSPSPPPSAPRTRRIRALVAAFAVSVFLIALVAVVAIGRQPAAGTGASRSADAEKSTVEKVIDLGSEVFSEDEGSDDDDGGADGSEDPSAGQPPLTTQSS